jgi:hypothetical protein
MMVECAKSLTRDHPVGSVFKIQAKVTNKEGGTPFIYSYHGWAAPHVTRAEAEKHIRDNAPWSW